MSVTCTVFLPFAAWTAWQWSLLTRGMMFWGNVQSLALFKRLKEQKCCSWWNIPDPCLFIVQKLMFRVLHHTYSRTWQMSPEQSGDFKYWFRCFLTMTYLWWSCSSGCPQSSETELAGSHRKLQHQSRKRWSAMGRPRRLLCSHWSNEEPGSGPTSRNSL